ncbi:MAG: hypothetical protein M1825_000520 [Sarcosagium campestre]|nr:MAG: hypothetical protein M1825_000520 [Sarcosagium campestre]
MTLYYSLVFVLLVSEMILFMLLVVPIPFTWRRKLFNFISESPLVAKAQYGLKICFIAVLILFIDSVNRVYRVQVEQNAAHDNSGQGNRPVVLGGSERMEVQARKFYSQRNMYLCGFTLFLSLILNRTYTMILDVLRLEEKVKQYESDPATKGRASSGLGNAGGAVEIEKLKKQLAEKDRDLETLKKQSAGLSQQYVEVSDRFNELEGTDQTPKKDR